MGTLNLPRMKILLNPDRNSVLLFLRAQMKLQLKFLSNAAGTYGGHQLQGVLLRGQARARPPCWGQRGHLVRYAVPVPLSPLRQSDENKN